MSSPGVFELEPLVEPASLPPGIKVCLISNYYFTYTFPKSGVSAKNRKDLFRPVIVFFFKLHLQTPYRGVENISGANYKNYEIFVGQKGVFTTMIQKYWWGSSPLAFLVPKPL